MPLVRLTKTELGALRSLASITYDTGEGTPALKTAVEALDAAQPDFTRAELNGMAAAGALLEAYVEDDPQIHGPQYRNLERIVAKVYRLTRRS